MPFAGMDDTAQQSLIDKLDQRLAKRKEQQAREEEKAKEREKLENARRNKEALHAKLLEVAGSGRRVAALDDLNLDDEEIKMFTRALSQEELAATAPRWRRSTEPAVGGHVAALPQPRGRGSRRTATSGRSTTPGHEGEAQASGSGPRTRRRRRGRRGDGAERRHEAERLPLHAARGAGRPGGAAAAAARRARDAARADARARPRESRVRRAHRRARVTLRHNHVGSKGMAYLAAAMRKNAQLQLLALQANPIGDTGVILAASSRPTAG